MSDEQTYTIKMTNDDISNLLLFLERTTMRGTEVPVYNGLVSKVINASHPAEHQQEPTKIPKVKFDVSNGFGG